MSFISTEYNMTFDNWLYQTDITNIYKVIDTFEKNYKFIE